MRRMTAHCGWLALLLCVAAAFVPRATADPPEGVKTPARPWTTGLDDARRRAMADGKPILVRAGAEWCPACRVLEGEIAKAEVQQALADWTLVEVDVDRSADEARQLAVTATPTLKILSVAGQPVASHVGILRAGELAAWLREHQRAARAAPDSVLLDSDKPSVLAAVRLVGALGDRNPAVRQAAAGRLEGHPDVAGGAVFRALREGTLAQRLCALELFETWKAPIDGLDPWQPDSIDADRLARLEAWIDGLDESALPKPADGPPETLTDEQLAAARLEIDRMLRAGDAEAAAIRDRLARLGPALAEEIDHRLGVASDDRRRERLRALRYRLSATDALVLRWPGGIERLAATDAAERRRAAEQLADLAAEADQSLLLRLFADPDPLVRELGLRGLQRIGGAQSTAALADLLSDPEPNVRAAVLKLLEDSPQPAMVPKVAEYLKTERDPDLIVHAVRFLRASGGATAIRAMMELVEHESWQVRAEAAAGLGGSETSFRTTREFSVIERAISSGGESDEATLQADAYAVLIRMLDDSDAFVVSRAVEGLSGADLAVAVEPLVEAAAKHPELAAEIVSMLAGGGQMRPKAIPHLRRFAEHEEATIRAAAIHGLARAVPAAMEKELAAALRDEASEVRTAGAAALWTLLERSRENAQESITERQNAMLRVDDSLSFVPSARVRAPSTSLLGRLGDALRSALGGSSDDPPTPQPEPPEPVEPDDDEPLDDDAAETEMTPEEEATPEEPSFDLDQPRPPSEGPVDGMLAPLAEDDEPDEPVEVPDLADPNDPGPDWDRWLVGFYEGKGRPVVAATAVEPLRKMLAAEDARERMAAALTLVPLGHADEALPVLLDTVREEPSLRLDAADVLPWLVWERRIEMFHTLRELLESDDVRRLVYQLAPMVDRRAVEVAWELLGDEREGRQLVGPLRDMLRRVYFGTSYYRPSSELGAAQRAELLRTLRPRAEQGGLWQRMVALLLMLQAAPDEAARVAGPLADDPSADEPLRQAAFQVHMAGLPANQRRDAALAALGGDDLFRVRLALACLAEGGSPLEYLRIEQLDQQYINVPVPDEDRYFRSRSGEPIIPEPPPGLKAEHVRPLIDHDDPVVAARAGYLLALLGDEQGLEPLLRLWQDRAEGGRPTGRDDVGDLDRLVYRAIAILNDSSRIDVLRTIRKSLGEYDVSEFYWTIRIMSGPDVLQLRKEIRDELGTDRLR